MIDICEIFTLWHAGRSKNEIAGSLGLSRNTVRKYVAAAEAAGMVPGGPAVSGEEWARLAREWFPELADTRLRQLTWPAIGEHLRRLRFGLGTSRGWRSGAATLPWSYRREVARRAAAADAMVDMGTRGGERLSRLSPRPRLTAGVAA